MPSCNEYTCVKCGAETFVIIKDMTLTPFPPESNVKPKLGETDQEKGARRLRNLEWARMHIQILTCNNCDFMLFAPKLIRRLDWNRWKQEDSARTKPYTTYPFLKALAERIDSELSADDSGPILLSDLNCPYCRGRLSERDELRPKCQSCDSIDMMMTGSGIATMSLDFPRTWPPIV